MKTQEEIVARIEEVKPCDWMGTQFDALIVYLDVQHLRPFLKKDMDPVSLAGWEPPDLTREGVIKDTLEYLDFAFEKAINHRGISASRSVEHMQAYLWLLGDNDLLAYAENEKNYTCYGVPILKAISEKYDKPMPAAILNWPSFEPCKPDCEEGCRP